MGMLSATVFGANPAEEMFKTGATTGGTDPHGNSWLSIQHSIQQFAHPEFLLRLFLGFTLAVPPFSIVDIFHYSATTRRSRQGTNASCATGAAV